jgi:hypothetical protein
MKWISVKESLPKIQENVLFYDAENNNFATGIWDGSYFMEADEEYSLGIKPTHWCDFINIPLPSMQEKQ